MMLPDGGKIYIIIQIIFYHLGRSKDTVLLCIIWEVKNLYIYSWTCISPSASSPSPSSSFFQLFRSCPLDFILILSQPLKNTAKEEGIMYFFHLKYIIGREEGALLAVIPPPHAEDGNRMLLLLWRLYSWEPSSVWRICVIKISGIIFSFLVESEYGLQHSVNQSTRMFWWFTHQQHQMRGMYMHMSLCWWKLDPFFHENDENFDTFQRNARKFPILLFCKC